LSKKGDPTKYVLGVAMDHQGENVCLIRKRRPDWQAGLLNGVGGKVEVGETSHEAMVREFLEETGVRISDEWFHTVTLSGGPDRPYLVHYYGCFTDLALKAHTRTDEGVEVVPVSSLVGLRCELVDNLIWVAMLNFDPRRPDVQAYFQER
jgi:8-oxo-dGTP diphosphatase